MKNIFIPNQTQLNNNNNMVFDLLEMLSHPLFLYWISYVSIEDHVVAGVGAAEDGGGYAVTGGRELGSLALTPPISVGILTKMKKMAIK